MTNFNFLSKSSGQSMGHSSVTLASTVGSPSVHRRGTMLKHVVFLLLFLFSFGVGNVWGATASVSTPTLQCKTSATTMETGKPVTYMFSGNSNTYNPLRWYSGVNLTIAVPSGYKITEITLTAANNYNVNNVSVQSGGGTYSSPTWTNATGSTSVVLQHKTSNSAQTRITGISVTYESTTPAYAITPVSNNTDYGTVSLDGTTITATPADCYQVASGASGYTVTSGTATVSHTGSSNTLTVTPSSDCTVQVNFEKKTVNTYIDEIQDNGTIEDCSTTAPSLTDKTAKTTGSCAEQHWHFVGWVTAENKANPTNLNVIAGGSTVSVNGTTYYAVWAKGSSTNGTSSIDFESSTSTYSDWTFNNFNSQQSGNQYVTANGGSYYGTTGGSGSGYVKTKNKIASPTSLSVYLTKQSTNTASSTWYVKVSSDGSSWSNVTSRSATNMDPGSWVQLTADLSSYSNVYVELYYLGSTAVRNMDDLVLTYSNTTFTDYITTCCTSLGSINGSFS